MFVVALALAAGCGFTPERAVLAEALRSARGWTETPIDASNVRVLQTAGLEGRTVVLVGMARAEKDGQRSECVFVYEAVRGPLGWRTGEGGGGCGPGARIGEPMWIGSAQNHSMSADAWSRVDGLVHDDAIVRAQVVWDDGTVQEVEVIQGSVLAVRGGTHRYDEVRGLDPRGEVVCVHEEPGAAARKQGE